MIRHLRGQPAAKERHEVAVEFHGRQPRDRAGQGHGERPPAGTDFNDLVPRREGGGLEDAGRPGGVEEMLAEAAPRLHAPSSCGRSRARQ